MARDKVRYNILIRKAMKARFKSFIEEQMLRSADEAIEKLLDLYEACKNAFGEERLDRLVVRARLSSNPP